MQAGGVPDTDEAHANWIKLKEYGLQFQSEEDRKLYKYVDTFYNQMASPPDLSLVREYFEKMDDIEVVERLNEVTKAQVHIRTNFLSIVRNVQEQQLTKDMVMLCRDASAIAEHGRVMDGPGKKKTTLRGALDAANFMYENLHKFAWVEGGEKLEGSVPDDAQEVLDEYDLIEGTNKFANRNLFGLEPVDSVCKGHKKGEFWVHTAFVGELKCLAGTASIFDHETKRRRMVRELYESKALPTITALRGAGEKPELIPSKVSRIAESGVRPVYEIVLESGRRTRSTANHGFLGLNGWKELSQFSAGDWVAVPKKTVVSDPSRNFSDAEVKAVGYLLGDGTISKDIWLTAFNDEIRDDFVECLVECGYEEKLADFESPNFRVTQTNGRNTGVRVSHASGAGYRPYVSRLRTILGELSLYGKGAYTKFIPDEFFGLSEHQTSILLGALWSTDGSIHVGDHERKDRECVDRRNDIKYYSMSERLCLGVQSLLLRLGIRSTVSSGFIKWKGQDKTVYITRVVGSRSKRLFCDLVSVVGKDYRLDSANVRLREEDDTPYPKSIVPDGANSVVGTGNRRYKSQMVGDTVEASVLQYFRHVPRVAMELDGDVLWERVESIRYVGDEMTYDIEVPTHRSFVVDDLISHNSTLALNYAYNNAMIYGKNIFYAILEMPYKQLRRQLYAIHSSHGKFVTDWHREDGYTGLDYRQLRDGELSPRDRDRLRIIAQDFQANSKGKLYVWRPQGHVTIEDVQRKGEMFHNKYGCDGMVVDHLGLVKPKGRYQDTVSGMNEVVRDCRIMALNFGRGREVPVLALFQMNRQGKMRADKADGYYDIAAISYANEVEKSADAITYTYLNDRLRKEGMYYLGCLKNRDNPPFERMIGKILWQSKRMRAIESGHMLQADSSPNKMVRELAMELGDVLVA